MSDENPNLFVPVGKSDATSLAMIEALRAMADSVKGMVQTQEGFKTNIGEISATLHSIDKRTAMLEGKAVQDIEECKKRLDRHSERHITFDNRMTEIEKAVITIATLTDTCGKLGDRVDALEDAEIRRDGATGALRALKDYGPWVAMLIVALISLVVTGKVHL